MTFSQFISKLNWRLMVIHLVAYWFLWEAAEYFASLYDFHFMNNFYSHHQIGTQHAKDYFKDMAPGDRERLVGDSITILQLPLIGFLAALTSSVIISIKKKWFWLNSVIVFTVVLSLTAIWNINHIKVTPWTCLRFILNKPGYFFDGPAYLIVNGFVLLAIGLCLFFLKTVTRFIDGKKVRLPASFELPDLRGLSD